MSYREEPHIAAAINLLLLEYGSSEWWVSATQVSDGAGARILVQVNGLYQEDVLPRKLNDDVFIVVQRWEPPVVAPTKKRVPA